MSQYKCVFYVNSTKSEQVVSARSSVDAKRLIEAQYAGAKVRWISCNRV